MGTTRKRRCPNEIDISFKIWKTVQERCRTFEKDSFNCSQPKSATTSPIQPPFRVPMSLHAASNSPNLDPIQPPLVSISISSHQYRPRKTQISFLWPPNSFYKAALNRLLDYPLSVPMVTIQRPRKKPPYSLH